LKVRSLIGSSPVIRGLFAVLLVCTLAAAGAAPLTASAEVALPAEATVASVEASAPALASIATLTAPALPATVAVTAVKKKLTVRQTIAKVGRRRGLSRTEIAAMLWMAKRESNFHPWSESRSECHGLFQLSKGMAHGHPWKNPEWNTRRAIRYMRGRYGGVLKAKAFWMSHHWY
jgi:hypothetical protein